MTVNVEKLVEQLVDKLIENQCLKISEGDKKDLINNVVEELDNNLSLENPKELEKELFTAIDQAANKNNKLQGIFTESGVFLDALENVYGDNPLTEEEMESMGTEYEVEPSAFLDKQNKLFHESLKAVALHACNNQRDYIHSHSFGH